MNTFYVVLGIMVMIIGGLVLVFKGFFYVRKDPTRQIEAKAISSAGIILLVAGIIVALLRFN